MSSTIVCCRTDESRRLLVEAMCCRAAAQVPLDRRRAAVRRPRAAPPPRPPPRPPPPPPPPSPSPACARTPTDADTQRRRRSWRRSELLAAAEAEEAEVAEEVLRLAVEQVVQLVVRAHAARRRHDRPRGRAADDAGQQRLAVQRGDHAEVLDAEGGAAGEEQGGAPKRVARLVDEREPLRRARRLGRGAARNVAQRLAHRLLVGMDAIARDRVLAQPRRAVAIASRRRPSDAG